MSTAPNKIIYSMVGVGKYYDKKPVLKDIYLSYCCIRKRNRTSSSDNIYYGLYLYFLSLSYRSTAKALSRSIERSHVAIWKWIQRYKPEGTFYKRRKVSEFIIDITQIKIGEMLNKITNLTNLNEREDSEKVPNLCERVKSLTKTSG